MAENEKFVDEVVVVRLSAFLCFGVAPLKVKE
jgi:hypothetical protein